MPVTLDELESIYGQPAERSILKEITFLNEDYQAFVRASPFVILATGGPQGMDCSPKGDAAGFVRIIDAQTLAIPDRPGNNRIDSLRNIIAQPGIGLLFIVPGVGETLRVNGQAEISTEPELLDSFAVNGKLPRTVIVVCVETAYFHCSRALVRSDLWNTQLHIERSTLPSTGSMLKRLSANGFDSEKYDRELSARVTASLY